MYVIKGLSVSIRQYVFIYMLYYDLKLGVFSQYDIQYPNMTFRFGIQFSRITSIAVNRWRYLLQNPETAVLPINLGDGRSQKKNHLSINVAKYNSVLAIAWINFM